LFVVVGTISVTLFQFDLVTVGAAFKDLATSLLPFRVRKLRQSSRALDRAIEGGLKMTDLRHSGVVKGEVLNDAALFFSKGMSFEEMDEILASQLVAEVQLRRRSADVFFRASQLAPALGLLGTIVGLVGVLRSLGDPSQIGGAMSLALLTTAYGAALGSLICAPAAGRIEACADSVGAAHREIIRKLHILYLRSEMDMTQVRRPGAAA
jgi:chemotaxis protein MotA